MRFDKYGRPVTKKRNTNAQAALNAGKEKVTAVPGQKIGVSGKPLFQVIGPGGQVMEINLLKRSADQVAYKHNVYGRANTLWSVVPMLEEDV